MNVVKGEYLKDMCEEMIWEGVRDKEGGDVRGKLEICSI